MGDLHEIPKSGVVTGRVDVPRLLIDTTDAATHRWVLFGAPPVVTVGGLGEYVRSEGGYESGTSGCNIRSVQDVYPANLKQTRQPRSACFVLSVPELLEEIIRYLTLDPGDIVSTRTPAGIETPKSDSPKSRHQEVISTSRRGRSSGIVARPEV